MNEIELINSIFEKPKKSPFKSHIEFETEIKDFANKYKTTVSNNAKRTSEYFEMACYNYIIKFYELLGYDVTIQNLQSGSYRYKCTPSGIQSNFSYFKVGKKEGSRKKYFEIHHNLAIQSSQDKEIFTSPDIAIIKKGKVKYTTEYYDTKRTFSYAENKNMITFCEVKQFNPFPELLFNFIGVLNELKYEYILDNGKVDLLPHIAPSLMVSGKPNKQTKRIRKSLEDRYCINIFYDLFYSSSFLFSKQNISQIRKTGKKPQISN